MRWSLALVMIVVVQSIVTAQRFIVKGGVNFYSVNEQFQTRKIKFGTTVGVGFEYPIAKQFFIQPEFNFTQKGYKYEHEYFNELAYGFMRRKVETNYLEVPILLKYRFNAGVVKYSFLIGPTVGGVFGGKVNVYSVNSYRLPPDLNVSNRTRKIKFDDIIDFHFQFEKTHPFQDGNGRVGRLILFKECLAQNIVPFIIEDEYKFFYYRGLTEYLSKKE